MVLTVLAPIGGIEAALIPLCRKLKAQSHETIVYAIEPVSQFNQNVTALQDAGIAIFTSPRWLVRLVKLGNSRREQLLKTIIILAAPLFLLIAFVDAFIRRRTLRRSWNGAIGQLHGILSRWMNFDALFYLRLKSAFWRRPPDLVHVHGWGCGEDPPYALQWLRQYSYPLVYTEHNSPDPALQQAILKAPMNLADVIIAVSQAGKAGLIKVGGASRPIEVIPYGIEPLEHASKRPVNQELTVTCVARLMPQKGHRYLLKAMACLIGELPGIRLLLAGDGPLRPELESEVRRLGLDERVQFLGIVTRTQMPELLAQTDVVVLASFWEGLPVALIEAMRAGKPIVATHVGGNPELVTHGVNGLIVPPGNSDALAEALRQLQFPQLRQLMGEASRRHFAEGRFSPMHVSNRHLAAYRLAMQIRNENKTI
jgi:glycosyltransferase involved in cell wall biosynthesis